MNTSTGPDADTILKVDGLAVWRLLINLWPGFGSYAASLFLIIPAWTGLTRGAWLTVTLVSFADAVAFLFGTLAAFAPAQGQS